MKYFISSSINYKSSVKVLILNTQNILVIKKKVKEWMHNQDGHWSTDGDIRGIF